MAFTTAEVQSLVNDTCSPCHTTGATQPNMNDILSLTDLDSPTTGFKQIVAGDRASSYFFIKVSPDVAGNGGIGSQMPLGRPAWDDETIERVGLWIDSL